MTNTTGLVTTFECMETRARWAYHHLCANGANELRKFGNFMWGECEKVKCKTFRLARANTGEMFEMFYEGFERSHGLKVITINTDGVVRIKTNKAHMLVIKVELRGAHRTITVLLDKYFCDVGTV